MMDAEKKCNDTYQKKRKPKKRQKMCLDSGLLTKFGLIKKIYYNYVLAKKSNFNSLKILAFDHRA